MGDYNVTLMTQAADQIDRFIVAAATKVAVDIVMLNNDGGSGAVPAPKDTGQLRGSPRVTINESSSEQGERRPSRAKSYPLTGASDVRKAVQLGGMEMGDTLWISWIAPYANIIDGGRRPDKNGRMIGSEQAPDGWVAKGIEVAIERLQEWEWNGGEIGEGGDAS